MALSSSLAERVSNASTLKVRKTRSTARVAHAEHLQLPRQRRRCSASPSGRSSRSSRGCRPGRSRRSRHASPGRGRACRARPSRRRCRARLHSMQTLCGGMFGRRPCRNARDHLEQLALVDRAAVQLEVDRDVRGDRRRGRERRDVLGRGVDDRDELVARRRSCAAPGCRRRSRRRRS